MCLSLSSTTSPSILEVLESVRLTCSDVDGRFPVDGATVQLSETITQSSIDPKPPNPPCGLSHTLDGQRYRSQNENDVALENSSNSRFEAGCAVNDNANKNRVAQSIRHQASKNILRLRLQHHSRPGAESNLDDTFARRGKRLCPPSLGCLMRSG